MAAKPVQTKPFEASFATIPRMLNSMCRIGLAVLMGVGLVSCKDDDESWLGLSRLLFSELGRHRERNVDAISSSSSTGSRPSPNRVSKAVY